MSRMITTSVWAAQAMTAGQVLTSPWFDLLDKGCNGYLSYQFDITGSVKITVERGIIQDTSDPVTIVETTHATAKGIKDVDMVPARFVRFKATETTGSTTATITKMTALFM